MPAIAPFYQGENRVYPTEQAFLTAVADALHEEYQAIVDAGFILQIDDPGLPTQWDAQIPAISVAETGRRAAQGVEVVTHAWRGILERRFGSLSSGGGGQAPTLPAPLWRAVVALFCKVRLK